MKTGGRKSKGLTSNTRLSLARRFTDILKTTKYHQKKKGRHELESKGLYIGTFFRSRRVLGYVGGSRPELEYTVILFLLL